MPNELKITRRHFPHWTLEGSTYFITFSASRTKLDDNEQRIVLEHIKEGDGKFYDCFAAIVMPTHVHLLLRPMEGFNLSRIMKGLKGVSAHKLNLHRGKRGRIWQGESYDRIVRDNVAFNAQFNYMLNNPVKAGLTDDPWNYVGWYFNHKLTFL